LNARAPAAAAQIQQALALIHGGHLARAASLLEEVLQRDPLNFNALQLRGQIALQTADYAKAERWLSAARSMNASSAPVHSNLSVALLALNRPREALECCERALVLKAQYPEAFCNRGHALVALNQPKEALASYDRAISQSPAFYDAYLGRAKALLALGHYAEALASCDRALALHVAGIDAWCQRGAILLRMKRAEEALSAFDRALALRPDSAEVLNDRGTALRVLRRPQEALDCYAKALQLRPMFAEVYCNVANVGLDAGKYDDALRHCERALSIRPDFMDALKIQGTTLDALRRHDEAAQVYEKILAKDPSFGHALSQLLFSRAHLCNWAGRADQIAQIVARIGAGECASSPHSLLWMSDSAPLQQQCARLYTQEEFPAAQTLWQGERWRHERLRIAYVSADFTDHPVSHLIAGVIEHHDRRRFETYGISLSREPAGGAMRTRMQRAFEHFHDLSEVSDLEAAAWLREREIDVLIDLNGHTRGGRMGIMAFRPAPTQINFLGFAGTSGAAYIDYVVGDHVVIPVDQEGCFDERIIRMPDSCLPNDDLQRIAESPRRRDLELPDAAFVFCAFNNSYKLNPAMFDIWMRLLKETPGSVLWLRSGASAVLANLRREAERRGVASERLVFASRIEAMQLHLARYRHADLFLDTLPYGAHATARDALWAGLPVLTCAGNSFAARVAASLLTSLCMPELISADLEDYARRALTLAHSPGLLAELRQKLAHQCQTAALFDTDRYREHLESALLTVSERQRRGDSRESFSVSQID
jgi:predicted O-linked N-acetylglucosamine transferase (SPINDLY family)